MPWRNYAKDLIGFAKDILGVDLTDDQKQICLAIITPPFMVFVESGHNVGKTFLAAVLTIWWYCSFDPGVVITTAPTKRDVEDLLWTEVRLLMQNAKGKVLGDLKLPMDFIGPSAPAMHDHENHWAKGYTVSKGESFQGRHRPRMFFIFDECEAVEAVYWDAAKTMFKPEEGNAFFVIGNPLTTTSRAYLESCRTDRTGKPIWKRFQLNSLKHPNIKAQFEKPNEPPPIPSAVTIAQIEQWIADWCEVVDKKEKLVTDFQWPPDEYRGTEPAKWYRPGPIGEPRILGRRPSQGTTGVWYPALFDAIENLKFDEKRGFDLSVPPEIGCDCATKGDDFTAIHIRWGIYSIHHETHNGWNANKICHRLKELANWAAETANKFLDPARKKWDPKEIPIKLDDDMTGGAVISFHGGFRMIGVCATSSSFWKERYPNKRSELWFVTRARAEKGLVSISRLDLASRQRLRVQALAPLWEPSLSGQRVVEPKKKTKETTGRSPDDMDAMNLAYAVFSNETAYWVDGTSTRIGGTTMGERQGLLGREPDEGYSDQYDDGPRYRANPLGR